MLTVLHISTWDNLGGSARAAYRVHSGLKRLGVRSRMLVGWRMTEDEDIGLLGGRRLWMLDRLCNKVMDKLDLQYLFYPSSFALPFRRWCREANIIQLHNTHGGYFSHTALPFISMKRPVVWWLSDMWPMTGHCVYSYGCERWTLGCGSCPILDHYPALHRDRTALLWRVKKWAYRHSSLTVVTPSKWMANLAARSPLLQAFPIHVIPHGLDTDIFRPIAKESARRVLGVPIDKRVLLFGAHFISDPRKGGALLVEALERLGSGGRTDIELLVFGRDTDKWTSPLSLLTKRLGVIHDDVLMAAVYSAADVFVLPTLADNFPNGIIESMACGTPVVSFTVGGVPELVRHMETGYLAQYLDATDLAKGLQTLLDNADLRSRMGWRCREVAEQEYALDLQARRFLNLYREVIERHRSGVGDTS